MIASLTKRAREQGIDVMVVSGDRDVYQLVEDGVRVMTTSRGVTDTKIYDAEGVKERYGVPPELVTDLIGLKGDTSDNIPGVPGIGDKTAAQLLQEFGSLEEVLANVDKISGAKRKENLTNHADDARISKQLATAILDIDFELDLDELMASRDGPQPPARGRARARAAGDPRAPGGGHGRRLRPRGDRRRDDRGRRRGGLDLATSPRARSRSRSPARPGPPPTRRRSSPARQPDLGKLAKELAGRPLIGHDIKSLGGGGQHGLLAACASEDEPRPPPRHDGRRLPARPGPPHLRPDRDRRPARPRHGRPSEKSADDGQLELDEEPPPTRPPRRAWSSRSRSSSASRMKERGLEKLMDEVEMPLVEVLAEMERVGRQARRRAPRRDRQGLREADRQAAEGHPQARRPRVHDRLAAAALRGPLRRARPDQEAARQDRLLDRRPRPRPDPRRARDHPQDRAAGAS